MKLEAKVGVFVLVGILGLFALTTQVGSFSTLGKKGYTVYAGVSSVAGLDKNAKVKIAGVEVGFVKEMTLEGKKPKLELVIYDGVQITKDAKVMLVQSSMLGQKYVEIIEGASAETLARGAMLDSEYKVASFDQTVTSINEAAGEFKAFMGELRTTFDPNSRANLQEAIANFNLMAKNLALAGGEFSKAGNTVNDRLPRIMAQVDDLSREFAKTGKDVNAKLPEMMDRFIALEKDLSEVVKDNNQPLKNTLNSVDKFFTEGSETLKKVDKYVSIGTKSRLEIGLRTESYPTSKNSNGYLSVDFATSPTNSYLVDIVSVGKDYTRKNSTTGLYVEPSQNEKGKSYVSAQFGKRFDNLRFRGGLAESTGGVGLDHYANDDKLKTSLDLFDFGAVNDVRGTKAHAKLAVRYKVYKRIDLIAGYDNFFNTKAASVFGGVGVSFVDDDLKYLLGPAASFVK
jgi:phospholipid/cholesterol/gamma-HCH transport system substrate-binding protein